MKGKLQHVQINVSDPKSAFSFYKNFLGYFEYKVISEGEGYAGFSNGTVDFWIGSTEENHNKPFHRKQPGTNHYAFVVEGKEDVDKFFEEFLQKNKIETLYDSPKAFPEYTPDYYAVFFEGPDRIKLEVMYTGDH